MRTRLALFWRWGFGSAFLAAALILGIPHAGSAADAPAKTVSPPADPNDPAKMTVLNLPDMSMGKQNAPLNIVEYASMTCPHCAHFDMEVFPELKKNYIDTGKVYYVFREFPLDGVALRASMIARCMDKSHFFSFVDKLFRKQIVWANPELWNDKKKSLEEKFTPLAEMAKAESGMTRADFDKCLANKDLMEQIALQAKRGTDVFNVPGTPAVYLDGKLLINTQTFDGVDADLKKALQGN